MSGSNCCFLSCIQVSQEAGKVVWYSYLFQNCPQFVVTHTVKGFRLEKMFFWNFLDFSVIQQTLAVWSLIPLPFQNPACTSGSSQFLYCWSLSSVQSDSLWSHGLQHARLPCPSPTPRAYSNSCPLSQWCHPTIPSSVIPFSFPSVFPSIRVFYSESILCIRWPKYWSFSFSISPSNEYSGLISLRLDWLDLLSVQGTLKSLLQHHSSKASILRCSTFFIVQLSHPYMTTGKTIALTRWMFVGKVMYLLFNMLSSLVIALQYETTKR